MAKLYITATPIGNMDDITLRALRVLAEVNIVLAEDTRHTGKLLARHNIKRPMVSFHEHNEKAREERVLLALEAGKDVALVTDAGTPLISDPGQRLVAAVHEAGHEVVVLPGASAVIAAVVGSGLPATPFTFVGFLPRKKGERQRVLERLAGREETLVFFESPKRVAATLGELAESFGESRLGCIARELTKVHEEFRKGTLGALAESLRETPVRGEITLLVEGNEDRRVPTDEFVDRAIQRALDEGHTARDAARLVSEETSIPKREVYSRIIEREQSS